MRARSIGEVMPRRLTGARRGGKPAWCATLSKLTPWETYSVSLGTEKNVP